ncbi:endonuclease/exonuclease/phosphatase family protein [Actibacterium sp. D379-3]
MATYNTELSRKGPGLLLRDIAKGDDPQVTAIVSVIAGARPDILLLQGIDYDHGGAALAALAGALAGAGIDYPYRFAAVPNAGQRTGFDHDGDGTTDGPRDAQGYGRFTGQGGLALLSRYPIDAGAVRDFSGLLWADLPGATLPQVAGALFPDAAVYGVQRLSSVAHWDVPVRVAGTRLHLLAFHATPPVFDGPEDRNGLRNRDELRLWQLYLDGALSVPPPDGPVVVLGDANLDPLDGEGRHAAMAALLADSRLRDPMPHSAGGRAAGQAGVNAAHAGDPGLDTADWDDAGPGNLRTDYVLPAAGLTIVGAGVVWPEAGAPGADAVTAASRHRLVWVDLRLGG